MSDGYTASEDIKEGASVVIDTVNKTVRMATAVSVVVAEEVKKPIGINQIPNDDIIEVMTAFEVALDIKLRPVDEQRRYAKFLIKDYGKDKVLEGVRAVAAARGRPYSPSITSLKELHFKWGKLVDFYKRNQPQPTKVQNLDNI